MRKIVFALLALPVFSSVGCSLDASLGNLVDHVDIPFFQKVQGAEFVSGSTQFKKTSGAAGAGQFKVQASVGHWHGETLTKTVRGYTAYTSVQAQMISEEH